MSFTFDETLSTDLAKVRFHTGDTDANGYYLSDALITALVSANAGVGGAVVASLKYILSQLSKPNFTADWLTVDLATARAGIEELLELKRREFGIASITASTTNTYRADSRQIEEPDYTNGVFGEGEGTYVVVRYRPQ